MLWRACSTIPNRASCDGLIGSQLLELHEQVCRTTFGPVYTIPAARYHAREIKEPVPVMSHFIAQPCIGVKDTACVTVCPVDCIHPTKDDADFETADQLFIDPDTCIDCGLCVDECPVTAIFPQEDLPEEWASFIEKNTQYFKK
jgi:NAD-dependent dihydropyrimidine dehydrogenase PreA subunit